MIPRARTVIMSHRRFFFRAAFLLAPLLLLACQPLPHPFEDSKPPPASPILSPPDAAGIVVGPVAGAPGPAAAALAAAMVDALQKEDVPADTAAANEHSYRLAGTATTEPAGDQLKISIAWRLSAADGHIVATETETGNVAGAAWRQGDATMAKALVAHPGMILARRVEGDAPLAKPVKGATLGIVPVTGASRDGSHELSMAIAAALNRAGVALQQNPADKPSYLLAGKVEVGAVECRTAGPSRSSGHCRASTARKSAGSAKKMRFRPAASTANGAIPPTTSPPRQSAASCSFSKKPRPPALNSKTRKIQRNRHLHFDGEFVKCAAARREAPFRAPVAAESVMKILACNSNRPLAEAISAYLSTPLTDASVRRFSDMEVFVEINENVRGEDVFVIQSTSFPANDNLMELLVTLDALRRSSARRATAVIPYYGYARQDRKTASRSPISAKLVANMITIAGADRVLTLDLHAGQIQGFFDIPTDNLFARPCSRRTSRNATTATIW